MKVLAESADRHFEAVTFVEKVRNCTFMLRQRLITKALNKPGLTAW
jgi:hypothetical protein